MNTLVIWLLSMGVAVSSLLASRVLLHYFQLESYQFPGYFRTVKRNFVRASLPGLMMTIYLTLLLLIHRSMDRRLHDGSIVCLLVAFVTLALAVLGGMWCRGVLQVKKAKKPFVVTMRVKRTWITSVVVFMLICALIGFLLRGEEPRLYFIGLFPLLMPMWIALGGLLAWPIEKLVSEMYFRDAQKKLAARQDLIKIGITGSYGKTSTKFILGTLLKEKYNTLMTPSSFNTPMGVTRIVREQLKAEHEVFIAEMGARHKGDIAELVDLVHPTVGVLTSVGPQHLETFGTIEVVAETKYELIAGLPANGAAFFAADGAICESLYEKTTLDKTLAGLEPHAKVRARDIAVSNEGSSFTLVCEQGEVRCTTPLLGRHNIQNAVLCASVALHLGLTLEQVASGMSKLEPVEHRLQLIKGAGGVTVIDDAFNANPAGAKAAMEVLGAFPGRRICVTPGMVELGAEEKMLNHEFGKQMAAACDIAVLIGIKRTEPIYEGLLEAGFEADNVLRVNTLAEATDFINKVSRAGDVVLFENDLPDNYNE